MDYVREELLRQSRALEALMRTGAAEDEPAEREETERRSLRRENGKGEGTLPPLQASEVPDRSRKNGVWEVPEGKNSALWAEAAGEMGGSVWEERRFVSFGRESVREVSRAIERDVRRYDGGFTMY